MRVEGEVHALALQGCRSWDWPTLQEVDRRRAHGLGCLGLRQQLRVLERGALLLVAAMKASIVQQLLLGESRHAVARGEAEGPRPGEAATAAECTGGPA